MIYTAILEQKQPVSQTIEFKYHELTKEDFLDSVGIFYTDLSDDEIDQLATQLSTPIIEYEDTSIPYSMILELNLFNFIILFIVILIIYGIYTSYSLKKIGIKKSMGFSTLRILKEQIISVAKYYPIVCLALLAEPVLCIYIPLWFFLFDNGHILLWDRLNCKCALHASNKCFNKICSFGSNDKK